MKVLYLHQYFTPPSGSGGIRSYLNAKEWVGAGTAVTILTSPASMPVDGDSRKQAIHDLRNEGIETHVIGPGYSSSMKVHRRVIAFFGFALAASLWVLRHGRDFDIVYATSTPLTIAIPAMMARVVGRPWVLEVRDVWPEMPIAVGALRSPTARRMALLLERVAYGSARSVVALSPAMADSVHLVSPNKPILVVPNYADVESVALHVPAVPRTGPVWETIRKARRAGRAIAVYVGSLNWLNDVDFLVRMAADDRKSEFTFLVVGEGSQHDELIQAATERGVLNERVHFFEPVSSSEALAILAAADVSCCFFRSIVEMEANSANKFFSSLAAGTCVAINYGGWQEEVLQTSGAGLRVPSHDPAAALDDLVHFVRSPRFPEASEAASILAARYTPQIGARRIFEELSRQARPTRHRCAGAGGT